jgi:hypothetical protein
MLNALKAVRGMYWDRFRDNISWRLWGAQLVRHVLLVCGASAVRRSGQGLVLANSRNDHDVVMNCDFTTRAQPIYDLALSLLLLLRHLHLRQLTSSKPSPSAS